MRQELVPADLRPLVSMSNVSLGLNELWWDDPKLDLN